MSLFNNADQPLFDGDDVPAVDPNQNYLEALVGEGKKFKTPEELARGKAEADAHIAKLLGELNALRGEVTSRKRLEELVDQLATSKTTTSPSNGNTDPHEPDGDQGKQPPAVPDVKRLLEETLAEREREATRKQNLDTVRKTLTEKLGPGYANIIKQQAPSLGMTTDELTELAASKPKAFFRLVGITDEAPGTKADLFTPPDSSVRTGFKPTSNERNYAWWSKLRRENPSEYWKRQSDMHADATRLGPDFYN
jgi:hypothetical protein